MDYLPLLVTAFFLCSIVRSIWKSWTAPKITSYLAEIRARLEAEGVSFSYLDGGTRDRDAAR